MLGSLICSNVFYSIASYIFEERFCCADHISKKKKSLAKKKKPVFSFERALLSQVVQNENTKSTSRGLVTLQPTRFCRPSLLRNKLFI